MTKPLGVILYPGRSRAEWAEQVAAVQIADELGVDSIWLPEAWGRDAFPLLTELALKTERINLATGIVNVFSRSPALIAMTAATIDEMSGGRLILGLGTSGANVVEHWHGIPFNRPLTRLKEYVEIIRSILRGERVFHDGEVFHLERGFQLQFDPVRSDIPIVIAAISPQSIRQTGAIADGIMPTFWPREHFGSLREMLQEGAQKADRTDSHVFIAPMVHSAIDDDAEAAKSELRRTIAYYIGRMGVYYQQMFSRTGYADDVRAVRIAWERRDPAGAEKAVSDELVEATCIFGPLEQCATQLATFREAGVEIPVVDLPNGNRDSIRRTLRAFLE